MLRLLLPLLLLLIAGGFVGAARAEEESPLQKALKQGLQEGGDLHQELRKLGDYQVKSASDANAICAALKKFPQPARDKRYTTDLSSVLLLLERVPDTDSPAYSVLRHEGLLELMRIVDLAMESKSETDDYEAMLALKILAIYGTPEGTDKVIQASNKRFAPDDYMWSQIFSLYLGDHPHRELLLSEMTRQLPVGYTGVTFLDAVNQFLLAGNELEHPFDTPDGKRQLEAWLTDADKEKSSYAHSAAVALPFISEPECSKLLALAMAHADTEVQIEGCWAAAMVEQEEGITQLARHCLDVNYSELARRYLEELGREDAIPEAAQDRNFRARAKFADWLAHPNELGHRPDSIEIVDSRKLRWPTNRKVRTLWIVKYVDRAKAPLDDDEVDWGLVGSVTFCLFSPNMPQRPEEDVYAIHALFELRQLNKVEDLEATPAEGKKLLQEIAGDELKKYPKARFLAAYRFDPKVRYPAERVALAATEREGEAGFVVFDGPRTTWYPAADFPANDADDRVLDIHTGRQLLGFTEQPQRRALLVKPPPKDPALVVATYEAALQSVETAEKEQREELLSSYQSVLVKHFEAYVDALAKSRGIPRSQALLETYELHYKLSLASPPERHEAVFGFGGVVTRHFDDYVTAALERNRQDDLKAKLTVLEPHWKEWPDQQTSLGIAAFKLGNIMLAEQFLTPLRKSESFADGHSMSYLAECWSQQGKHEAAQSLLVDCLKDLQQQTSEETYTDIVKENEDSYVYHLKTLQRLYPEQAGQLLAKSKLPGTLLETVE